MRFVWCVQSPGRYEHLDAMRSDNSSALALSFKEQVPGQVYLPMSTWTEGRNELAKHLGDEEYAIFMDDDVVFEGMTHAEGFRKFERLLDEFSPAMATPGYEWHLGSNFDPKQRLQGLIASDAILFALHRDVWPIFLPYWSAFDSQSWWNSQHVLNRIAAILYPGGTVQFNDLRVVNKNHGDYPRDGKCEAADAMISEMLKPDFKHLVWPHNTPESYDSPPPVLRQNYKLTRDECGRYFDLNHPYWRNR